jgi:hypothetical protein
MPRVMEVNLRNENRRHVQPASPADILDDRWLGAGSVEGLHTAAPVCCKTRAGELQQKQVSTCISLNGRRRMTAGRGVTRRDEVCGLEGWRVSCLS